MPKKKTDVQKDAEECRAYYHSPIGSIEIRGNRRAITSLGFGESKTAGAPPIPVELKRAVREIDEYFRGERKKFSLNLVLRGTEFQKKVWRELMKIPFGETASYKDIARAVGQRKAFRAVGNANRRNNISIIIPCHRVVGTGGDLTGYGGGLWRKKWLLEHEQKTRIKK